MGTRCLTYLYNDDEDKPFICIYRQFDGYPSGHGHGIATFMNAKTMVNGYNDPANQINGMGCLAAQLIVFLKDGICEAGGIYVYGPDMNDCWQDYEYHIWEDKVEIRNPKNVIFSGNWKEFLDFCEKGN